MHCWRDGRLLFVRTPAKLNLFLDIHARRPDGFHELETLAVRVGIYDTLCFQEEESEESHLRLFDTGVRSAGTEPRGSGLRLTDVPAGPDNLVLRAVRALQEHTGADRQVRITVWKQIPVASGLAGGSSDAAAVLVGLNRFWGLKLDSAELLKIGAALGSDVNFFLARSSAAVCRGRGELIEPVRLPVAVPFVVARPQSGLSTAEVYGRCRPSAAPRPVEPLLRALQRGEIGRAATLLHNALQGPAAELNSDVSVLRRHFERLPVAGHQMTGSGTAWFGLCFNRAGARRAAARLRAVGVDRVFATTSVT